MNEISKDWSIQWMKNTMYVEIFYHGCRLTERNVDEWMNRWIGSIMNRSVMVSKHSEAGPRSLWEVCFSFEPHCSSLAPWGGKLQSSLHRSTSLAYAGGGKHQPPPHHSSSLAPGRDFMWWLDRDVGGGSYSSSMLAGGSSSFDTPGWLLLDLLRLQRWVPSH
jgi:hypothetical protein